MGRLTLFELQKVWWKRSFQLAACGLLLVNLFFLWYANLGDSRTPPLSSYRLFSADLAGMTEAEKDAFVADLKQTIDGVSFVERVLAMQRSETGADFARQELAQNPGVFEAYYDLYASGDYLRYTDSLALESAFIQEMYAEERKVAGYASYLESIQEKKASLNGASIFGPQNADGFAARNIKKSAADFKRLSAGGIQWAPSKAVAAAMENVWTDILLILLSFLFIGGLITEEKQNGLLYITRCTRHGMGFTILAKLFALLIHCLVTAVLLYGENLFFFGLAAGWCDMTVKLQSLAAYQESCLPVSILEFTTLSVVTKALVLFAAGTILTALCILSESAALPYCGGMLLWAGSWALYRFVPAASKWSAVKYLNLFGALRAETVYGAYLNLNLWEYPVSRLTLSWLATGAVILTGAALSFVSFVKGERLGCKRTVRRPVLRRSTHASLLRHEGYKLLITNHALIILLIFCILIGGSTLRRTYTPTAQEQYYQSMMLQLEGGLTEKKAALIEAESARFTEAFTKIESIDAQVASGRISSEAGDAMKLPWYRITAFYPEFQRIERQYELVRTGGGKFIYDTGYLYLFGILGESVLRDYLLLTAGTVLAFSAVISMEHQCGAWAILCATAKGKRGVITRKIAVCGIAASVFWALPFAFRWISVARVFPLHGLLFPARSIPFYQALPPCLPLAVLLGLKALLQITVGLAHTLFTVGLSGWRKNQAQALFFGLLILCVPVIMTALGFESARWFSAYPFYAYTWQGIDFFSP